MEKPLVILTGPTAVGKTALSIGLAKAIGGEIISADSMQVYRGMDIGSAKIRPDEMEGVPHHLIDVLEPEDEFHVVIFQKLVKECHGGAFTGTGSYSHSHRRNRLLYPGGPLYDIDFTENGDGHGLPGKPGESGGGTRERKRFMRC